MEKKLKGKKREFVMAIFQSFQKGEIQEIYQQYEEQGRMYDVFRIECSACSYILKKVEKQEIFVYETYLKDRHLAVPDYFGSLRTEEGNWLLMEYCQGNDLSEMRNDLVMPLVTSLSQLQRKYWKTDIQDDRFERYLKRIQKRAAFLRNRPRWEKIYHIFIDRQKELPLTLSCGDLLACHVIETKSGVKIIDWGFGGKMPYTLDVARFIAHSTVNKSTFPFYMSDEQKTIFVQRMYERLPEKMDRRQYQIDLELAIFNEYVEFMEAKEDFNHYYEWSGEVLLQKIEEHF